MITIARWVALMLLLNYKNTIVWIIGRGKPNGGSFLCFKGWSTPIKFIYILQKYMKV